MRRLWKVGMLLVGFVLASLCLLQAPAQPRARLSRYYQEREKNAPPAIKKQLAAMRRDIKARGLGFEVGYTKAMDDPLRRITSGPVPPDMAAQVRKQRAVAEQALRLDKIKRAAYLKSLDKATRARFLKKYPDFDTARYFMPKGGAAPWPKPTDTHCDFRTQGIVSPVRNQMDPQSCGSCWVFGTLACFESAYANHYPDPPPGVAPGGVYLKVGLGLQHLSEQYLLDFSGGGDCNNGSPSKVLDFLKKEGAPQAAAYPYKGYKQSIPKPKLPLFFHVNTWDYVGTSRAPTVAELKQALCDKGPLVSYLDADKAFQKYTVGVFQGYTTNPNSIMNGNHWVEIIGWDDKAPLTSGGTTGAWLCKNSWGTGWGENGFFWIKYNNNLIGTWAMWIQPKPFYLGALFGK